VTVFRGITVIFWLAFILYWAASAFSAKRTVGSTRSHFGIGLAFIIILLLLFHSQIVQQLSRYDLVFTNNPLLGWIGVALCGGGITFAIWARFHLGRNWGMPRAVKEDPELVTTGPYTYVRHPIYTGVMLGILGSALVSGLSWLVLFVIASAYFIYSAKTEEAIMMRQFPAQYTEYKNHTKMLVPYIF